MVLTVKRQHLLEKCTIGRLFVEGQDAQIYTLEPKVRPTKIYGHTAIPEGRYRVVIDFSNHFQRELPHVLNVPDFDGVRIHPGNTDEDTEGCILLGYLWEGGDFIGRSRDAFEQVFTWLRGAKGDVFLEVVTDYPKPAQA